MDRSFHNHQDTRGAAPPPAFRVAGLTVRIDSSDGPTTVVDDVSFEVPAAGTLAIVGESGSGKTVTMLAALGLLNVQHALRGEVSVGDFDLLRADDKARRAVLGREIGFIFQNPSTALDPVMNVGDQIIEAIVTHQKPVDLEAARAQMLRLLTEVGIADPELRSRQYPHQFSGGMAQRVMIAIALANSPAVIIADEPTTAVDATIQAQILKLLADAKHARGAALAIITHDLGVVAEIADEVIVMYAGQVVERGSALDVLTRPLHPYTRALLRSIPRIGTLGRLEHQADIPSLAPSAAGCRYRPRCAQAKDRAVCRETATALRRVAEPDRLSACHFARELAEAQDG
jgi:oligopeptide/dipeptide ABC transporter ATP-binding protein